MLTHNHPHHALADGDITSAPGQAVEEHLAGSPSPGHASQRAARATAATAVTWNSSGTAGYREGRCWGGLGTREHLSLCFPPRAWWAPLGEKVPTGRRAAATSWSENHQCHQCHQQLQLHSP